MPQQQSRSTVITKAHRDKTWRIHTGRTWLKIRPTMEMIALKFGEFAKTRRSRPYVKKAGGRTKKK